MFLEDGGEKEEEVGGGGLTCLMFYPAMIKMVDKMNAGESRGIDFLLVVCLHAI